MIGHTSIKIPCTDDRVRLNAGPDSADRKILHETSSQVILRVRQAENQFDLVKMMKTHPYIVKDTVGLEGGVAEDFTSPWTLVPP